MKTLVKMLLALCATALCLTSDSATSVTQVQISRFKVQKIELHSSSSSSVCVATTPMPKSSVSPNWAPTACVPPKR